MPELSALERRAKISRQISRFKNLRDPKSGVGRKIIRFIVRQAESDYHPMGCLKSMEGGSCSCGLEMAKEFLRGSYYGGSYKSR